MAGSRHVEALALREGVLRFYLTDLARTPIPLDGARGTVTVLGEAGAKERLVLAVRDGAFEARRRPFAGDVVEVRVEAALSGEQLLIDFTLPVRSSTAGGGGGG